MSKRPVLRGGLAAALLVTVFAYFAAAQEGDAPPLVKPFVDVPAGQVLPGCTDREYNDRHRGNSDLKQALMYDVWGAVPQFPLPAFQQGRFEVTNAQWKYYLDKAGYRVEHETEEGQTLKAIADQYVKFRNEGIESEWKAIYALNWRTLVEAWQEAKLWQGDWSVVDPPHNAQNDVGKLPLPKGLKLVVYTHRIPEHWYGWCTLADLQTGKEYVDATKPAEIAFRVPNEEPYKSQNLRDNDFGAYPVRSVSPNEMLDFAEWAGCQLPTEYEFERAARGDNLRWPFAFGVWDHNKQKNIIACGDNERTLAGGPLRVDDGEVSASDTPFGARHVHGNVWELTRTFYDVHPRRTPSPPPPADVANYALVAKGGSFGDRWQLLWICARTGKLGVRCELSLRYNNRADSLGLRLVRHPEKPGSDLLLHSIRRLTYDAGASRWSDYLPHHFAMQYMDGVDDVKIEEAAAPYIFVKDRAYGIAFAPLFETKLDQNALRGKPERHEYYVLGAFRSDVPLVAGVCLTDMERRRLTDERERYDKLIETYKKLPPKKRANVTLPDPPADYEPDDFEKLTEKNADVLGLWREKVVPPGEWFVVYWNGYIGLANKTLVMPPDAIFTVPAKQIARKGQQPAPAQLTVHPRENTVNLKFSVWERPTERRKYLKLPGPEHTDEWALAEAYPEFFLGKGAAKAHPHCWEIDVTFKTEPGALDPHEWKAQER